MTDTPDTDAPAVRIVPPLIALGALVVGVALQFVWPLPNGFMIQPPLSYWIGGIFTLAVFIGLGRWAMTVFRDKGEDPKPWTTVHGIVETGPYRFSRNPMYVALILMVLGFAVLLSNVWILVFTPVVAIILRYGAIKPEEAYLEAKFGDAYRAYKQRVRRWL